MAATVAAFLDDVAFAVAAGLIAAAFGAAAVAHSTSCST